MNWPGRATKALLSGALVAAAIAVAAWGVSRLRSAEPAQVRLADPPSDCARRADGAIALVLGSGGPRGFAHIGVLDALSRAGFQPSLVVGSSMGAIVGALYAGGLAPARIESLAMRAHWRDWLGDLVWSTHGWFAGEALQRVVGEALDGRPIERLSIPFVAVATRLPDGELRAFDSGDTAAAVRASAALPGLLLPVRWRDAVHADGDLASPLPVDTAIRRGATKVLAIDVSADLDDTPPLTQLPAEWVTRDIARRHLIEREAARASVVIRVPLPYYAGMSESYRRMAIAAGRQAVEDALPRLRAAGLLR